ncbi:PQQ-binding-like beta-propeller repeat protein [Deinococcus irradiatisoli]|nr:PQQ-binding-like beta-propeller repeat protein [Deinococcus irradiatisoli]
MKSTYARLSGLGFLGGLAVITLGLAASSGKSSGPEFTAKQVSSGQQVYTSNCQSCHGQQLEGGVGPAIKGSSFSKKWLGSSHTVKDLYTYISSKMPLGNPHSLTDQQYLDVTAFVLSKNGYSASGKALDKNSLGQTLAQSSGGNSGNASGSGSSEAQSSPTQNVKQQGTSDNPSQHTPVPSTLPQATKSPKTTSSTLPTDQELMNAASSSDWLMYNKDFQGQRFSGLKQITADNAGDLKKVCEYDTGEQGPFQPGMVQYKSTLYFTNVHKTIALNATNCNKLWVNTYKPQGPEPFPVNRGVALYDGKIFRGTPDGHLIAIDKNTGQTLWNTWVSDSNKGYFLSAAPIAHNGMVFIGEAGADWGVAGHMYAFSADTGKLIWTFDVVPTGDQQGADTWDKANTAAHGGGSMWTTYTLDPQSNLLYVSVGNPAPDFAGDYRPGKNLFTDSVVVLSATTGKLVRYQQQIDNDYHDWDTAASPVIYDTQGKKMMVVANKGGHLYMYDRVSQERLNKVPVTTISNADAPLTTEGTRFCPGTVGGTEWNGPAYDPGTSTVYVPAVDWCSTIKIGAVRYNAGNVYTGSANGFGDMDPQDKAGGWVTALDAASGDIKWKYQSDSPVVAGVTPTAGGVVLTGDMGGNLLALSADEGKVLFKDNTGGSVAGGVITYQVGDRQYVAAASGNTSRTTWHTEGPQKIVVYALPQGQK